jgi:hypothetical protein
MTGVALLTKSADEIAETIDQSLWKRLKDDGIYGPARIACTSWNIAWFTRRLWRATPTRQLSTSSGTFIEFNAKSRQNNSARSEVFGINLPMIASAEVAVPRHRIPHSSRRAN